MTLHTHLNISGTALLAPLDARHSRIGLARKLGAKGLTYSVEPREPCNQEEESHGKRYLT